MSPGGAKGCRTSARRWICTVSAVLGIAAPLPSFAQEPGDSLQWSRVRVTVMDATQGRTVRVGILSRLTADSLVLARGKRLVSMPRNRVVRVETSRGVNTFLGGLAGFVLGTATAVFVIDTYLDAHYLDDSENFFYAVIYGVPTGGLLGAGVGAVLLGERWSPVTLSPSPGGTWSAAFRVRTPR